MKPSGILVIARRKDRRSIRLLENKYIRRIVLLWMILSAGLLLRAQTRHYVKIAGTGSQNGLSWANAAPANVLRYVIANAGTTDTVWVQGSTTGAIYYPTISTIRDSAFVLANGVAVYGGVAAAFTGVTFGTDTSGSEGGGVLIIPGGSYTFTSCIFSHNLASDNGGGLSKDNGTVTLLLMGCSFTNNKTTTTPAGNGGGGVYNADPGMQVSNCSFSGNSSSAYGGGVLNNSSGMAIYNSTFSGNNAATYGGGYANTGGNTDSTAYCNFSNNGATYGGGTYISSGKPYYYTDTFANNTATAASGMAGAGIYEVGGGSAKYYGNIVWGNNTDGIAFGAGSTSGIKVKYNDFAVAVPFTGSNVVGNISTNPDFVNSGSYTGTDNMWATADDGLHLTTTSPAANVNQVYLDNDITDAIRPFPGNINADMGAYEGPGTYINLAIQLLNFTATPAGNNTVNLNWYVDDASQATAYNVQKSINGTNFSSIGTLDAIAGQTSYLFIDQNASGKLIYYRIQFINADGSQGFSSIAVVSKVQDSGGGLFSSTFPC